MTPKQKEYYDRQLKIYRQSCCIHEVYVIDCVFGIGSTNLGPVDPPVVGLSNDGDPHYQQLFQNWAEVNAFIEQVRAAAEQAWGQE
jgi:hypothetical protein